jgi:L-iditol 2-dehydrogenase
MNALRLHAKGDLRLHDEPAPSAGAGELLLRVTAVGLCGSDRLWFVEGGIGEAVLEQPLVLGHEFAATIESGPRAGERVAVDPAVPCEECPTCAAGHRHLCPAVRFAGHNSTDGALRTLMAWPERNVHRLPDSISDAEAAVLEPLGVALHAFDLGHVRPGVRAGVFGCGPIGLLLVQVLRLTGATTILAIDPLAHRVGAAEAMGATHVFETTQLPRGAGIDVAFEVAGEDAALESAIDAVRPGGRVVIVGIPAGDRMTFTASTARRKGLTLLHCRRMKPADLPRAIGLVDTGHIELGPLVSERYPLDEWPEAFRGLTERRGLKMIVQPQRASEEAS